ncbi:fluoride efflux transporter CrcB [Nocardia sp. NPDC050710]|uniref:fluoride efflux transporter CrcB n=1 Tax=Nocardia sp. NPDC050710 TaxID=3157220 RepID=UPI0033F65F2D
MNIVLLVLLGGMVGAPARYLIDRAVAARFESLLPLGTFTVNIVGSAMLGALIGAGAASPVLAAAGTGFCGALTTFSTFGYETIRLFTDGAYLFAVGNVVISVAAGLAAVYAAMSTTQWLWT